MKLLYFKSRKLGLRSLTLQCVWCTLVFRISRLSFSNGMVRGRGSFCLGRLGVLLRRPARDSVDNPVIHDTKRSSKEDFKIRRGTGCGPRDSPKLSNKEFYINK